MLPLSSTFTGFHYSLSHYMCIQNGVEKGDILDELCGERVFPSTRGKVNFKFANCEAVYEMFHFSVEACAADKL